MMKKLLFLLVALMTSVCGVWAQPNWESQGSLITSPDMVDEEFADGTVFYTIQCKSNSQYIRSNSKSGDHLAFAAVTNDGYSRWAILGNSTDGFQFVNKETKEAIALEKFSGPSLTTENTSNANVSYLTSTLSDANTRFAITTHIKTANYWVITAVDNNYYYWNNLSGKLGYWYSGQGSEYGWYGWGRNNNGDDGSSFRFTEVERIDNTAAQVTYSYQLNGTELATSTSQQTIGDNVAEPDAANVPAFTAVDTWNQAATVAADGSTVVVVTLRENLPFTVTTDKSHPVTGLLRMHTNQGNYGYLDTADNKGKKTGTLPTDVPQHYYWYIMGDITNGFQLYNLAGGGMPMQAVEGQSLVCLDDDATPDTGNTWHIAVNTGSGSVLSSGVFSLKTNVNVPDKPYLNSRTAGIGYWTAADQGSGLQFIPQEYEVPTDNDYTIHFVNAPEGTTVSYDSHDYVEGETITINGVPAVGDFTAETIAGYSSEVVVDADALTVTVTYNEIPSYSINFINAPHSHSSGGRVVSAIKLGDQSITINGAGNFYQDLTATESFTVETGETVKPAIIWNGMWMHGLVYLDTDASDFQFTEAELVSNTALTGDPNLATGFSEFTVPSTPGDYRMRYKVDWASKDPGGASDLCANGGYILDVMLHVVAVTDNDYTIHFVDAPEGAYVTYNGENHGENDIVTITGTPVAADFHAATFENYTSTIEFDTELLTITITYVDHHPHVVAHMKDLVAAATNENQPTVSPEWNSTEVGGKVYEFNGTDQYISAENEAVANAFKGDGIVTVAAWVYGNASTGCLFGNGENGKGVKFYMNGSNFRTTTWGVADLTLQAVTGLQADQWNLVAFAFPGKASSVNSYRYYTTATDGQRWTKNIANDQRMNDPVGNFCAIGSGYGAQWKEGFNGMISNLVVIESSELLSNSEIAAFVGEQPTIVATEKEYTIAIVGAPEDTQVEYGGNMYGNNATFTALSTEINVDAITAPEVEGYKAPFITISGTTITITYTKEATIPEDGKTYYIYSDNKSTTTGGVNAPDVHYYLYYNGSNLALSDTRLESDAYMWTCTKIGDKYTFRNVQTETYMGFKVMSNSAYNLSISADAAQTDGCVTIYGDAASRYLVIPNGGSGFDQGIRTYNKGTTNYSSDFVFEECTSSLQYYITVQIFGGIGSVEIDGQTYNDGDAFTRMTDIEESNVHPTEISNQNANIAIYRTGRTITIVCIYSPLYDFSQSGTPTQVRYWFDTDGEVQTADYAPGAININASTLDMGIHALYYQVADDKGQLSPVRFANFYHLPADVAEDLGLSGTPTQVRYWFDTNGEVQSSAYKTGTFGIDASALDMGIHALYYQVADDKGQLSPVRFANFYHLPADAAEDLGLSGTPTQVRYWFDTDGEVQSSAYKTGTFGIDASALDMGIHALYYQVADDKGQLSPVRFANFYRLPAEGAEDLGLSGTPTLVRYWADTDHEHMQQTAYVAGHTIINLSMFGEGEPGEQHVLRYQVIDDKGNMSPVRYVGYIYDKHQQVIVLEEWEILKRFHDASVQQGEWTRNVWSMEDGPGETADESLEHLPGVSLVDGHVRSIDLSQSGVTGNVLSLAELPELEHLNLSGNAIANVELPLISETATANLRNQTIASKQDIVWDTPTEQSLTENLPNIMRLSADARSLAEQYTWTLWNAPTATGWRMSIVMKDAMPELRQVSNRIYDNANGGDATLQVTAGVAAGTTIPVQFHYLDGDANLSGTVDVLDVQTVVNESFGIGSGLLNKQAADLQADGTINVLDLVRVVNVLLAQEMPSLPADTRSMAKANTEQMGCVSLECINGNLRMESSERVCALDIWLCLPQGSTEDDVKNLLTGFDLATRQSGNLCHIVLYSPIGMEMDGMGEALLCVPQGTSLLRASAANAEANSLSVSIGQTTNITETSSTSEAGSVYDLQGRISTARGLHITKQHGIYTKSLTK